MTVAPGRELERCFSNLFWWKAKMASISMPKESSEEESEVDIVVSREARVSLCMWCICCVNEPFECGKQQLRVYTSKLRIVLKSLQGESCCSWKERKERSREMNSTYSQCDSLCYIYLGLVFYGSCLGTVFLF